MIKVKNWDVACIINVTKFNIVHLNWGHDANIQALTYFKIVAYIELSQMLKVPFPQIVINAVCIGGYDQLLMLDQMGKLDKIIQS